MGRLEWQTRRDELLHAIAFILVVVIAGLNWRTLSPVAFWGIVLINYAVNVIPIIVQRYNRFRLLRLMKRLGFAVPY